MDFTTSYDEVIAIIHKINPIAYGKTRNYLNGDVTKLSPYIARGVISTKQIAKIVLAKGCELKDIEPFLKQLAWRDYFQQVWMVLKDEIYTDIKQPQPNFAHQEISSAILLANTGIVAVDNGILSLQKFGYIHNHMRMYIASIACNISKNHWLAPAKWMYYYLLDADWGSNALSWQWVAGSFSNKKYFANQDNINKYCKTIQIDTFLAISYEEFDNIMMPEILNEHVVLNLQTNLPKSKEVLIINKDLPIYIYNFYNLDPNWDMEIKANRILLLSPKFFQKYPVADQTIAFILKLSRNISNIQLFVGEFDALLAQINPENINYKEHPTNTGYKGKMHHREWMFEEVKGYLPSFFAYWKKCVKYFDSTFPKL